MIRIFPLIMISILVFGLTGNSAAGSKSHRKAVEELFAVTQMKQTIGVVSEQLIERYIQQNPVLAPYRETIREFLKKHISWESLKEDIAKMYMQEFSEKETLEIVAFYKTRAGRKLLRLLPGLLGKTSQLGQKRIQAHLGELQRMIHEKAKNLNQTP